MLAACIAERSKRMRLPLELPAAGDRKVLAAMLTVFGITILREVAPSVSARILVVDAEAALAELICETLDAEGHRTVAVHDAIEALHCLSEESFDLVVSDAALPGLSGDTLAREVARVRPGLRRRILLTTGDPLSREPEATARRVDAELLRKPFELDELRRVVRTRLRRSVEP
jgi:DNA-binding response OmpR family regulator